MLVWRRRLRGKEIHPQFQRQIVAARLVREIGALFALISVTEQVGIELQFVRQVIHVLAVLGTVTLQFGRNQVVRIGNKDADSFSPFCVESRE
jgi:hypothetical protein